MENTPSELTIFDPNDDAQLPLAIVTPTDATTSPISPLSTMEAAMLENCETIIEQGEITIIEVGQALATINRGRLYRAQYGSFQEYCMDKWGFGRKRGYEIIRTSEMALEMSGVGLHLENINERQRRAVAKLGSADERAQAFRCAQKLAGRKQMTSRHIEEAVNEILGVAKPVIIDVEPEPVPERKGKAVFRSTTLPDKETPEQGIARLFNQLREFAASVKWEVGFANIVDELERRVEAFVKQAENQNIAA